VNVSEQEYTPDTLRAAFSDPERYVLPPGSMTLEPEAVVAGKFADTWEASEAWKKAYDEGEVCGMKSNTTDAENPYPEGSHPYCGWSFGFWGSRNASDLRAARTEAAELRGELRAVLDVAMARGERLGYLDDDYRQRYAALPPAGKEEPGIGVVLSASDGFIDPGAGREEVT